MTSGYFVRFILALGSYFYLSKAASARADDLDIVGAPLNASDRLDVAKRLYEQLHSRADSRFRPNIYGPPVQVTCDFFIQSLGPLDETSMVYHVDLYVRQRWVNPRLAFEDIHDDYLVVPDRHMDDFWLPDTFFPNLRSGNVHKITKDNRLLRIYPNGTVLYGLRMALQLYCDMDLRFFPFDYQDCPLRISSYSYTNQEVNMTWNGDSPIDNSGALMLSQFRLRRITFSECEEVYTTGQYPCLQVMFHVERESGFYILQIYISSWLVVCVSWLSFFLSRDAVPARSALGVTTVLSMATLLISTNNAVVRVSYARAIDVWFTVCMTMVFLALLEYVIVNSMDRWLKNKNKRERGYCGGYITPAKVDFLARIGFPLAFIIFNIAYWSYYRQPHSIEDAGTASRSDPSVVANVHNR